MAVTVEQPRLSVSAPTSALRVAMPLWAAVLLSRLVILVAGATGWLSAAPFPGWVQYDPTRSSEHLGWLGNVLAASVDRWDSIHYEQIAHFGYQSGANTSFFPLYPLLLRGLSVFTQSDVIAGVLISGSCFAIGLVLLYRLVSEEIDTDTARIAVLLLSFAPLSFYFTAVYTESLFLAMSVGAFYAARSGRWRTAALLAAACSATRVPGALVIVPVAYMWWQSPDRPRYAIPWLAIAPLPLAAYGVYLQLKGFGFLSPIQHESSVYRRTMSGPPGTIWMAIRSVFLLHTDRIVAIPFKSILTFNRSLLVVLGIALASLVGAWRRLPRQYALYAILVLGVDLWSPVPITPLLSFDRYVIVIFPLWIAAAIWIKERRATGVVLAICAVLLFYYVHLVSLWAFVA